MSKSSFKLGEPDPLDDVDAVVGVVALIAGMSLHRMRADARVEHLQAERHALLLGVADDLLEALDAVVGSHVVGDALAHAGEADHVLGIRSRRRRRSRRAWPVSTWSRYFGLLNPLTNGGSGLMSIVPIAQSGRTA